MENNLVSIYAPSIRALDLEKISSAQSIPSDFLLGKDGELSTYYIPFDYVNTKAKVVLVGITPGFTQWKNAMHEAQKQLLSGAPEKSAWIAAKRIGAFSGAMRNNLINLLDSIGVNTWLRIGCCDALFSSHADLVQTTSILRHPVFINGDNYNGTPSMVRTPFLRNQILTHFAQEVAQLNDPIFIPLGPKVSEAIAWLTEQGVLNKDRILDGLPHPSGANAERIAYFLGRKEKGALSAKTNAAQLDAVKSALMRRMEALA